MRVAFLTLLLSAIAQLSFGQHPTLDQCGMSWGDSMITFSTPDTINGTARAVYTQDTSKVAYVANYRNGKLYGLFEGFTVDGSKVIRGVFSADKREGEWTFYDGDGTVGVKGKYKEGVKHGFWAFRSEGCYGKMKNGKRHGKWYCHKGTEKECICWYKNGELVKGEECDDLKGINLDRY